MLSSLIVGLVLFLATQHRGRCLQFASDGSVIFHQRNQQQENRLNVNDRDRQWQSLKMNTKNAKKIVDEIFATKTEGSKTDQCGYSTCNLGKPEMLNVHLVPHSHDDVGWLSTVDQYYYGSVQYILDTVTEELSADSQRRFIYVELAYFTRWWNELEDTTRQLVKGLVSQGRLEFILGGWSMNDEATTHYSSIIDHHTHGFRFLNETFGECSRPRVGWQVDPFGHSREQASIFAQFGFDGLFFARMDYQDYNIRSKTKTLEHVWMASESLGDASSLFSGHLYGRYHYPQGFCFQCGDAPIKDDPKLDGYNVDSRVNDFIKVATVQAKSFATNHIMVTMGADFQYANARQNFKNMDKLIKYVNKMQLSGSPVNVFYSTPSCYLYAMNLLNMTYSRKDDDYFPYATREHSFWTGYYTSRPTLKGFDRTSNNFLQVCKQMATLAKLDPENGSSQKIDLLKEALGVLQHHDALSGTSKQHVTYDYAKMVATGLTACEEVVNEAYKNLLPKSSFSPSLSVDFCPLANASNCPSSETSNQFVVIIYNPIARPVDYFARIPVSGAAYIALDSDSNPISSQVVPLSSCTRRLPEFRGSNATGELVFAATLPPLGFTSFFVQKSPDVYESLSRPTNVGVFTIENEFLSLTFSGQSGLLKGLTNLEKSLSIELSSELIYYKAHDGSNRGGESQASGAYVFRSQGSNAFPVADVVAIELIKGPEVQEVRQVFSDWLSQVTRLYKGARYVEIEWTVGPIPVGDEIGKEVINRFTSNLNNSKTFYTDANGREILKRVRDYRPTWKFVQSEPISGNYFPVNSRIFIQDVNKNMQLTVLTDRSQGGSSIADGQIELMVHRRLLHDDALGVGEALNEPGVDGKGLVVRGKHFVFLDTIDSSARLHRDMAQKLYMAPSVSFLQTHLTPEFYSELYKTSWSGVKKGLPPNVHLLTLEQWHYGKFLLRLEHFYAVHEDRELSQIAEVDLKDLFAPFAIESVEEHTLGADRPLAEATRLQWNVQDYGRTKADMSSFVKPVDPNKLIVELKPMQIRTFHVTVKE